MSWHAAQWGAVATAAAGFMALGAAWWTVRATREAASENSRLLKQQIEIQQLELAEIKENTAEETRRQKLFAAYTFYKLAADVHKPVSYAVNNFTGMGSIIPRFSPELLRQVQEAYPLQGFLNRDNHVLFQLLDAVAHGEAVRDKGHGLHILDRLNAFRLAMTPAVVGLPKGGGDRTYGHNGLDPLTAAPDADI
ncbi:hypothetical protein LAV84_07000 [Rhizobium sp. VS19-DR104.2]|uniref:hypothetical protein n=1 Tax=unclassified Rhizobium TaxID=2613769 RepID=UPI001CC7AEE0|nr:MULTISPECIES: hypothetical protein [unclassified Rhizobium]MBZ5760295.1 hypothetical protein [Rhizobium sp. VS19-DR96]MBZ5766861.1 hypothetical protein [Rhizobium sp. VS19-DR129.2]MBZ5773146.1 hypothetical protein [Rhizobium sp. VS19-DRK62.2]MBZ5784130.1 hypothetical protein [Rhizobium sp. VS19-DR121]MBZ5802490.1 hypothetical protein [Rhizobium sp. VS19-DR181]